MKKLIAGLLLATAFVSGEEPAITRDEVASAIRNLGSEKYDERTAAFEKLASAGEIAYAPLKKVLESTDDREVKARIERLLPLCAAGGPVRDGVSIRLEVDIPDAKFGETVVLTTTIRNHTNQPRSIYVGINRQDFYADASALQFCRKGDGQSAQYAPLFHVSNTGNFGSAAGPRPNRRRLEPFMTVSIQISMPLPFEEKSRVASVDNAKDEFDSSGLWEAIGTSRTLKLREPGNYKLRVFGSGTNEKVLKRIKRYMKDDEIIVSQDLESNAVEFHLSKP